MRAINTIGYLLAWLFWYVVACVPAALFGSTLAASFYGFDMIHQPHNSSYFQGMYKWEVIGGVVSAMPGFIWVGVCQTRDYQKKQVERHLAQVATGSDASVWPPPPKSN